MAQASCPTCFHSLEVPDCLAFGLFRCPGCQVAFSYQPTSSESGALPAELQAEMPSAEMLASILAEPPRSRPPERPPTPPAVSPEPEAQREATPSGPALIGQHICQHCMRQLGLAINKKADAPRCPGCRNKTSVYALQFKCPHCHHLLESPKRYGGDTRPCPKCEKDIAIPRVVLEDEKDGADDLESFVCDCPSCEQRVVARRDEVGRPAICPLCKVIITVPAHGSRVRRAEVSLPREDRHLECRACGCSMPMEVEHCPLCGQVNRPSKYP
jgi:hypothetical protein